MDAINLVIPQAEPTVCAAVSYVQTLTTSENALYLWKLGFVMGVIACIFVWVAVRYVAPVVYVQGVNKGWW